MKVKDIVQEAQPAVQAKFGPGTVAGKKAEIVQPNGITTTIDLTNPENAAKFSPTGTGQLQFDQDPNPGTIGATPTPAQQSGQTTPTPTIAPGAPVNVVSDEQAMGEEQHDYVGGDPTDNYIKQVEHPRDDDLDENPELHRIRELSGMATEQTKSETPDEVRARMMRDSELIGAEMRRRWQEEQAAKQAVPSKPAPAPAQSAEVPGTKTPADNVDMMKRLNTIVSDRPDSSLTADEYRAKYGKEPPTLTKNVTPPTLPKTGPSPRAKELLKKL